MSEIPMVVTQRFMFRGVWVEPGNTINAADDAEASFLHYGNLAERTDTGPVAEVPPEQALIWAAERVQQIAILSKEYLQLKGLV